MQYYGFGGSLFFYRVNKDVSSRTWVEGLSHPNVHQCDVQQRCSGITTRSGSPARFFRGIGNRENRIMVPLEHAALLRHEPETRAVRPGDERGWHFPWTTSNRTPMNRLRWSGDSGSSRPLIPNGGDLSSQTIPDPGVGDDDGARPHRLSHHGVSPDSHLLGAGEMVTGRLKKDTQNPTLNWTFLRFHDVPEPWKSTGETVTVLVTNLTPAFWTILRCWETEHENTTGEQGPATSEIEWRPVGFLLTYTIAESSGHGYFSRITGASLPLYP